MNAKNLTITLFLALALLLSACSPEKEPSISSQLTSETKPSLDSGEPPVITSPQPDNRPMTPEDTVTAFYEWYLDYIGGGGDFRNPLADKAYREAPYLDWSIIQKVDLMLSAPDTRGAYDPFTCAQDIPPQLEVAASFDNNGSPVDVMSGPYTGYYIVVNLVETGIDRWAIREINCHGTSKAVVQALYVWALDYAARHGSPWEDRAYRESTLLTWNFIERIDRQLETGPLEMDPLLLSTERSVSFSVASSDDPLHMKVEFQTSTQSSEFVCIQLAIENEMPRVDSVSRSCDTLLGDENPSPTPEELTAENSSLPAEIAAGGPRQSAESFYTWYLAQYQAGNPLEDGAYKSSPILGESLAYEVEMLAGEGSSDPLLCSSEIPTTAWVDQVALTSGAAHVLVRTDLDEVFFTLEMFPGEQNWQIWRVICPNSPEGIAWSFYTWYLGYAAGEQSLDQSPAVIANPLADGAYRSNGFLTQDAILHIDSLISDGVLQADPFLNAQTLPVAFWVEPGLEPDMASVRLQFGPQSTRTVEIKARQEGETWLIEDFIPVNIPQFDSQAGLEVDVSTWQTYQNTDWSFSFRYPDG